MNKLCPDDNNYIDNNGVLNELTVTITLNEYRELIQTQTQAVYELKQKDDEIKQLREEIEKVRSTGDTYLKVIYAEHPEIAKKVCEFGSLISNLINAPAENTDTADDIEDGA